MSVESAVALDEAVRRIVADVLARDLADVRFGLSLVDDLGADSLDFLELVFNIERAFGVEITRGEMERAARGDMTPEAFAPAGVISDEGLERLRALMPESRERIKPGLHTTQILRLFTVETFANIVRRKLADKQTTAVAS